MQVVSALVYVIISGNGQTKFIHETVQFHFGDQALFHWAIVCRRLRNRSTDLSDEIQVRA